MGSAEKIEKITKTNKLHVELFAYLVGTLTKTQDGDSMLLDHTLLVYGSGLADGNRHTHHDLLILLAGGAAASIKPGRHVRYNSEAPLNNLFLALLDRMGVRTEKLGDSDGVREQLGELT